MPTTRAARPASWVDRLRSTANRLARRRDKALGGRVARPFLKAMAVAAGLLAADARADTYYWDTNGATAGSGAATGTWGTSAFWTLDATGATATGAYVAGSDVVFSAGTNGTTGTVTVTGTQVANGITFDDNVAVTLSGGTITLGGAAGAGVFVAAGDNAANTISTALSITGANTFQTAGTGVLTISGGVTGTGNLTLANNSTGAAGITIATGTLNHTGTVTNGGAGTGSVSISAVIGANVLSGGVSVVQNSGTSTLTLSGLNTYTGQTQILAGTLAVNVLDAGAAGTGGPLGVVPAAAVPASILISGGTLQATVNNLTLNANRGIVLGAVANNRFVANNGNFFYNGVIADQTTAAALTIAAGAGNYAPGGQSTYSGGTTLAAGASAIPTASSTGPAGAPTSGPLGTGLITFAGGTLRSSTTPANGITLANPVAFTADTTFISSGANNDRDVVFTGPATLAGGTRTLTVNTSPNATNTGVFLNGVVGDGGSTLGLTKAGPGTLVFGAANTYTGATTINAGTVRLAPAGSLAGAVVVNAGASPGTFVVQGSPTLGSVTVAGNATAATAGTLSLVAGTVNTVTISGGSSVLTVGGAGTNAANLLFEVGATADQIALTGGATAVVNPGGAVVNLTTLGVPLSGTNQTLIASPTTDLTGANFTLGTITGGTNNYTLSLQTTAAGLILVETANPNAAAPTLYFKGNLNNNLTFTTNALANNYTTDAAGTAAANQIPSAATDLHFYAASATTANLAATLGNAPLTVKTLTMDGGTLTTAVSIAPGGASGLLTVTPATATTGITSIAGAGTLTISAPVVLGADATITNNSGSLITLSGGVTGTADLSASNSAAGGLTISNLNVTGAFTRTATNSAAFDTLQAVGANVTAITQNNPNTTSSLIVQGANTAYAGTTTLNAGRLDAQNTAATNVIQALGTGPVILNGGTLDLRANGTGSFQTVVMGNTLTVAGAATVDVQRLATSVNNAIQVGGLSIGGGQLGATGANNYVFNVGGPTTITGATTFNPTTSPVNLVGKVTDNGNAVTVTGTGATRLFNTSAANPNAVTGAYTVNGGTLQGFAPAAGAAGGGSNSLGTATVTLTGTNPVLNLAPSFNGGLTVAPTAGLFAKGYTGVGSLAAANFLGASQAVTTATGSFAYLNIPAGGAVVANVPSVAATTFPTTTAFQFTGLINITTPGVYTFQSRTDDFGNLFVDGNSPIVSAVNTVGDSFYLTAGLHTIGYRAGNNNGNGTVGILYQGPDQTTNAAVPAAVFFNTSAAALATNFGNDIGVAAGTNATINTASNTTLGGLTMSGTGTGTTLNVQGSNDLTTVAFTGATTLTGPLTINNPTANLSLLGGASGGFVLTKTGFGSLTLGGNVNLAGITQTTGALILVAGANLNATPVTGTLGIDLGGTTQNAAAFSTYAGAVTNGSLSTPTNTFLKQGPGTLTLGTAVNTGTGTAVTINQGLLSTTSNPATTSTLALNYAAAGGPTTFFDPTSTLTLGGPATAIVGGGQLNLLGAAGANNAQTFTGTLVDGGASTVSLTIGTGGTVVANLGTLTRNAGGTVDIVLPAGTQSATNGVTVGNPGTAGTLVTSAAGTAFATVGGNDFAAYSTDSPGNIVGAAVAGAGGTSLYTAATSGATFTGNADIQGASFTAASGSTVSSIRFNTATAAAVTLTLAGTNTVTSGAVLFGASANGNSTITGGTIVPGAGQELVFINNKAGGTASITSVIANGAGGPTTVTYRANPNGGTTGALFNANANNTYTGPTFISNGRVNSATAAITTPFGTGANAIVYVDGTQDGQFFTAQNVTIANPFVIAGTGFNENGTRRGVIRLDSSATITPTLTGPITLVGDASIGNNAAINTGTAVLSGNIGTSTAQGATSFALTKVLTGNLRLTGTNSQTATNVAGGVLNINADAALGVATAPVTFTGSSSLQFQNATAITLPATRGLVIHSGVTATLDTSTAGANVTTTINGVISGAGNLTKAGANANLVDNPLVLAPANTFTGNVTISAGGLVVTNSASLGAGPKTVTIIPTTNPNSLPSLRLDGSAGGVVLPASFSFTTSYDALNTTPIANAGAIVNVAGNNTIQGAFALTSGGGGTAFNSLAGTLTLSGTITPTATARTLYLRGTGDGLISGVIANGSTVQMPVVRDAGAGTWTLSGANTYTGQTGVQTGTIRVGNAAGLGSNGFNTPLVNGGSAPNTVVTAGAALDLNGTAGVTEPITLNGTGLGGAGALINSNTTTTATLTAPAGGVAYLIPAAATGANSSTVTVTGGGGSGLAASVNLGLTASTFTVSSGGAGYTGVPAANLTGGSPTTAGTATALLGVTAGTFTITGGTTVYSAAPTVAIAGTGLTGATATAVLSGGTSGTVTGITITNPGSGLTAAPTITFSGGTVTTAGTNPTGTGALSNLIVTGVTVTAGAGYASVPTLTFSGGGATTQATATSNANSLAIQGVTLTNQGTGYTTAPTVTIPGGSGTIALTPTLAGVNLATTSSAGGAGNVQVDATVYGPGGLTKVGAGTLTLTAANTFGGTTTVSGGVVAAPILANGGAASSIGTSSNAAASLVFDGGTLSYSGSTTGTTDRLFTVTANGGTLAASGTGALNLTATGTIVASGTGDRTLTLAANNGVANTLAAGLADPTTGKLNLSVTGTGAAPAWVLTGNSSTLTGTTTVSSGTLTVSNTAGTFGAAASTVAVAPAGTLGGTGVVGGAVSVATGGTVTAGAGATTASAPGNLTINNGLSLATNSVYVWKIAPATGVNAPAPFTGTPGQSNTAGQDLLTLAGGSSLTGGGNFVVRPVETGGQAVTLDVNTAYSFTLLSSTGTTAIGTPTVDTSNASLAPDFAAYANTPGNSITVTNSGGSLYLTLTPAAAVPEPATVGLLAAAGLGLGRLVRRRRTNG